MKSTYFDIHPKNIVSIRRKSVEYSVKMFHKHDEEGKIFQIMKPSGRVGISHVEGQNEDHTILVLIPEMFLEKIRGQEEFFFFYDVYFERMRELWRGEMHAAVRNMHEDHPFEIRLGEHFNREGLRLFLDTHERFQKETSIREMLDEEEISKKIYKEKYYTTSLAMQKRLTSTDTRYGDKISIGEKLSEKDILYLLTYLEEIYLPDTIEQFIGKELNMWYYIFAFRFHRQYEYRLTDVFYHLIQDNRLDLLPEFYTFLQGNDIHDVYLEEKVIQAFPDIQNIYDAEGRKNLLAEKRDIMREKYMICTKNR